VPGFAADVPLVVPLNVPLGAGIALSQPPKSSSRAMVVSAGFVLFEAAPHPPSSPLGLLADVAVGTATDAAGAGAGAVVVVFSDVVQMSDEPQGSAPEPSPAKASVAAGRAAWDCVACALDERLNADDMVGDVDD
jgi:hypothetical protein